MTSIARRVGEELAKFLSIGADPGAAANLYQFYSKTVAGVAQLFGISSDGTVQQFTPASAVLAKDFLIAEKTVNQAFVLNNDVVFDSLLNSAALNLSLNVGTGQISGLQAGRTYVIDSFWRGGGTTLNDFIECRFYNVTAAAFIGNIVQRNYRPNSTTLTTGALTCARHVITPGVNTTISLRMSNGTGTARFITLASLLAVYEA